MAYKSITYKPIISGIQMDDIQTNNYWSTNGSDTNQYLVAHKWITYKPIISGTQMDHIQTNN